MKIYRQTVHGITFDKDKDNEKDKDIDKDKYEDKDKDIQEESLPIYISLRILSSNEYI